MVNRTGREAAKLCRMLAIQHLGEQDDQDIESMRSFAFATLPKAYRALPLPCYAPSPALSCPVLLYPSLYCPYVLPCPALPCPALFSVLQAWPTPSPPWSRPREGRVPGHGPGWGWGWARSRGPRLPAAGWAPGPCFWPRCLRRSGSRTAFACWRPCGPRHSPAPLPPAGPPPDRRSPGCSPYSQCDSPRR